MIRSAAPHPCAACPWRTENQGKRHPDGWYTKVNLRRLWTGLRTTGQAMTCHPTDATNPLPPGFAPVPEHVEVRECMGSLVLVGREVAILNGLGNVREYRRQRPRGLTPAGALNVAFRTLVPGDTPILGSGLPPIPDVPIEDPCSAPGVPWTDHERQLAGLR